MKAYPTEWLLEQDNPSVRYFTLKDLLDYPPDDPEVVDTKARIRMAEKVSKILSKQKPEGHWEMSAEPYLPKYKASYWQFMLLGILGLNRQDEQVRNAVDHIFSFQHEQGGLLTAAQKLDNLGHLQIGDYNDRLWIIS